MKKVIFVIFIFSSVTIYGQKKEKQHPIDVRREQCLNKPENQNTYGCRDCERIAYEEWDKEMNVYYKRLMSYLGNEEKEKLKIAQRRWIAYRDSEMDFIGTTCYNLQGTLWGIVASQRYMEIVRARAIELKDYCETLK